MTAATQQTEPARTKFDVLFAEFSQLADENDKLVEFVRDIGMKAQALVAAVDGDWQTALAAYQRASAELKACDLESEDGNRIYHRYNLAWDTLIDTPSPNVAALHFKLVTILSPKDGVYAPDINVRVLADAARLAGEAA